MILTNYYFLKDLYKHLPRQKRLPEALKTQASAMLAMNIIPTASISFNSTPTCTATTTMPSNDAKCPPLADKSDETAISLGKSHHHRQLLLLCM